MSMSSFLEPALNPAPSMPFLMPRKTSSRTSPPAWPASAQFRKERLPLVGHVGERVNSHRRHISLLVRRSVAVVVVSDAKAYLPFRVPSDVRQYFLADLRHTRKPGLHARCIIDDEQDLRSAEISPEVVQPCSEVFYLHDRKEGFLLGCQPADHRHMVQLVPIDQPCE